MVWNRVPPRTRERSTTAGALQHRASWPAGAPRSPPSANSRGGRDSPGDARQTGCGGDGEPGGDHIVDEDRTLGYRSVQTKGRLDTPVSVHPGVLSSPHRRAKCRDHRQCSPPTERPGQLDARVHTVPMATNGRPRNGNESGGVTHQIRHAVGQHVRRTLDGIVLEPVNQQPTRSFVTDGRAHQNPWFHPAHWRITQCASTRGTQVAPRGDTTGKTQHSPLVPGACDEIAHGAHRASDGRRIGSSTANARTGGDVLHPAAHKRDQPTSAKRSASCFWLLLTCPLAIRSDRPPARR
jgi:hypothetical protein